MDCDAGLEISFKVKRWCGIKPHGWKYETYGGYYVVAAKWAFFHLQVNYR